MRLRVLLTTLSLARAPTVLKPASGCPACAAVANELERQMHEEWGHLQLTVRDRKRTLAADAVREQACGEAVQAILHGLCQAVKGYALGRGANGQQYYQKLNLAEENVIIISGSVELKGSGEDGLSLYCEQLLLQHEDTLATLMADGTDDLITDMCVTTTAECTLGAIARIPPEGLPRRLHRTS